MLGIPVFLFNVIAVLFVISVIVLLKNENSSPAFFTNNNYSAVRSMVDHMHTQHLRNAPSTMNRALQSASTDSPTRISVAKSLTGHHLNHNITQKKAWMHLQEVNGLKNEEVVMVVTSTEANEGYYIRERIIASSRTWMRHFANVIVVIEDTFEMRFAFRNCEMVDYLAYTTFTCHNEPTYLLSRKCNNDYYGATGPCCKVDDAINFIVNVRPDFFAQIKFMLHCDDDMYWRPDQVFRWLASVHNSGVNMYPLIANLHSGDETSRGVWMTTNCKEVHSSGWYQPAMLNHALLAKMAVGAAAYGLQATCKGFDVTHDVGLGVYAWMHGAFHITIPQTNANPEHKGIHIFQPTDLAMHYVKHHASERCDGGADNGWSKRDRHAQNVVIGCGDINHPIQGHDKKKLADMYDAWEYYKTHGADVVLDQHAINEYENTFVVVDAANNVQHIVRGDNDHIVAHKNGTYSAPRVMLINDTVHTLGAGETLTKRVVPRIIPLRGYNTTQHSQMYDITKVWKAFAKEDCSPPGKRET